MPDGSRPPRKSPAMPEVSPFPIEHRAAIDAACQWMRTAAYACAAVAWLQLVEPRAVPGAVADPEGVQAHLMLFARHPMYWNRLCGLFGARGLSDRGAGW